MHHSLFLVVFESFENLTIFVSVQEEDGLFWSDRWPSARREGCLSFRNLSDGKPQTPIYRGNAEGAKLPHGYLAEKTSPGALELEKIPFS